MGKVLKILGAVFLVLVVGFVALLFWAHGEGEAQQRRFFAAIATGDPDIVIDMMDPESIGPIDPPILKMWMDRVNDKLGKYEGLAASDFNTSTEATGVGTIVESKGKAKFEKGQADVRLTLLGDKIVGFEVNSDTLKGNWLKLPLEGPLYRDRAKKFIKHLIDIEIDAALAMAHKNLVKKLTPEKSKAGMEALVEKSGALKSIKVIDEKFIDGEDDKSLKIVMLCEFEKSKMLSYVRFEFSSVCGHLLGFKIPYSAEEAGIDPAKAEGPSTE